MNHISKLATKFSNLFSKEAEQTRSPLLLQSLEDRVLYSAVPMPVDSVDVPEDAVDVDDVEFSEIQSNATFVFVDDNDESIAVDHVVQWEPGEFDAIGQADATLEDLEQLINSIEGIESDLTEVGEFEVARGLATAVESPLSQDNFNFDEGQSFVLDQDFFDFSEVDFGRGFVLTEGTTNGTLYNNGVAVQTGDTVSGFDIQAGNVVYVPDTNFVGNEDIVLTATSDGQSREFVFLYSGVADDGIVLAGDTFVPDAPDEGADFVFQADSFDSETRIETLTDGYVVVSKLGNDQGDVQFQIFDNDRGLVGTPVVISDATDVAFDVDVASLEDGGFLVAFASDNQGTVVQRYDSSGVIVPFDSTNETNLFSSMPGNAQNFSIENLGEDRFVLSFLANNNIFVASSIYDLDGNLENSFTHTIVSPNNTISTNNVLLPSGGYAVAILETNDLGITNSITITQLDPIGNVTATGTLVGGENAGEDVEFIALQDDTAVTILNSPTGVTGYFLNSETGEVETAFEIFSNAAISDTAPQAVVLPDGSFIVSYNQLGINGYIEVVAQRFDQDFNPVGEVFSVGSQETNDIQNTDLALLNDGTLISTFESIDADGVEIFQQQLVGGVEGAINEWISLNSIIDVAATSLTEEINLIQISNLPIGSSIRVTNEFGTESTQTVFEENPVLIFSISDVGDGNLEFRAPENTSGVFEGTITVTTNDQSSPNTFVSDFLVNVLPEPGTLQPIELSQSASFNVPEGNVVVGNVMANDPNGGQITYDIKPGNDDGDFFRVDSFGNIEFKTAPDFESEETISRNSSYSLTVIATNANGPSEQVIDVEVLDINDAPILTVPAMKNIDEDQTFVFDIGTSDQDGDTVQVDILSQADGDLFVIENGALRFKDPPNFEVPNSAAGTNTYTLTLSASDGQGGLDERTVTIDVQNIGSDEPPQFSGQIEFNVDERDTEVGQLMATDRENDPITFSLDPSMGDGSLFTVSDDGLINFIEPPTFDSTTGDNQYSLFAVASDGDSSSTQEIIINVINMNDAPVITQVDPVTIFENTSFVTHVDVRDLDQDDVTLSVTGPHSGILEIDANNNLVFINPPDFESPLNVTGPDNVYVVTVLAQDGNGGEDTIDIQVTVDGVNEQPFYIGNNQNRILAQDEGIGISHDIGALFGDPENDSLILDVVNGADGDLFEIVDGSLVLREAFEVNGVSSQDLFVDVLASDGALNSEVETFTVRITNVNDNPLITSVDPVTIFENERFVTNIAVSDFDQDDVTLSVIGAYEGVLEIDANNDLVFINPPDFETPLNVTGPDNVYVVTVLAQDGNGGEDTIDIQVTVDGVNEQPFYIGNNQNRILAQDEGIGISHDIGALFEDPESNTLTFDLGGADGDLFTIENGNLVLREAFRIDGPDDQDLVVDVVASDGMNSSEVQTFTVQVANVNDDPMIVPVEDITILENNRFVTHVDVSDRDRDNVTLSVTGPHAEILEIDANNDLVFINPPDFESPQNVTGPDNVYAVTVLAQDGNGGVDTIDIQVTVDEVNERPFYIGTDDNRVLAQDEGVGLNHDLLALFEDPENVALEFDIVGGSDADLFAIVDGGLVLREAFQIDGAGPRNLFVDVVALDGANSSEFETFTVQVANLNDAPILMPVADVTVLENETFVTSVVVSDPDQDNVTLTVIGAYEGVLEIDSNNDLVFINPPDFETPLNVTGPDNVYVVTVLAEDGNGGEDTIDIKVTVDGVNEQPFYIGTDQNRILAQDEGIGISHDIGALFGDPENDSLILDVVGGADGDLFEIVDGGLVLREAFQIDGAGPRELIVDVVANDGANNSDIETFTVQVKNVNDNPLITPVDPVTIFENERFVTNIKVSDPDQDDVSLTVVGRYEGVLEIDANNNLVFINPPDFEDPQDGGSNNSYLVDVRAEDGNDGEETIKVRVNVAGVDEQPYYIGTDENRILAQNEGVGLSHDLVSLFKDPENESLTFDVVGGANGDLFEIVDGGLVLREAFQIDGAGPRELVVDVVANDGVNNSDIETFTVQVTNVNDNPLIKPVDPVTIFENERLVTNIEVSDPDQDDVTLSVVGTYEGVLEIDANNNLVFINSPDFEDPQDLGAGNSFLVNILAEDGNNGEETIGIRVNVADVDEQPFYIGSDEDRFLVQDENTIVNHDLASLFEDPETKPLSLDIVGGADANLFEIVDGKLALREGYQINGAGSPTLEVDIAATDSVNRSETQSFMVQIKNVNDAPVFVTPPQNNVVSLTSNTSVPIYQLDASDRDSDDVTFEVLGTSASVFSVNNNGQLSFIGSEADFETLASQSQTEIQVRATDGTLSSSTLSIQINVGDVPADRVNFIDRPGDISSPADTTGTDTDSLSQQNLNNSAELETLNDNDRVNVITNPAGVSVPLQTATLASGNDIAGPTVISTVTETKIDDDESFLATLSDSVAYVYRSDSLGPQLISQEVGDVITRQRSGEESQLEDSFLAKYFWQGFDKSEDDYIRKNLEGSTTQLVVASAGLGLGLFSSLKVASMATTVVTQLPAWKTLDVTSLITEFDEAEAETIHQIVDE